MTPFNVRVCVRGLSCTVPTSSHTASKLLLFWVCVCVCFDNFYVDGFGHRRASNKSKTLTVCVLTFFAIGPCTASANSGHKTGLKTIMRVWSEGETHCSHNPRTQSIQRCRPLPLFNLALLPPLHQKEKGFFDDHRNRHSVFRDPQRNKNICCFFRFDCFGRTPPCIWTWDLRRTIAKSAEVGQGQHGQHAARLTTCQMRVLDRRRPIRLGCARGGMPCHLGAAALCQTLTFACGPARHFEDQATRPHS